MIFCLFIGRFSTCTFTDNAGKMYDLSSLVLFDDNYELMSTDNSMRFALSVCASLVHTRGSFVYIHFAFIFIFFLCAIIILASFDTLSIYLVIIFS